MMILLTVFSVERDPAGNWVVEFHGAIGNLVMAFAMLPFAASAGYAFAGAPLGIPLAVAAAFFFGLAALCIALLIWLRLRSRVRVSIDRARSCVLIDTREGRTELPVREIEKAEIGSAAGTTAKGAPVTRYRLEFVLRDRQRVPATNEYCSVSLGDCEGLLEALNHELGVRTATPSPRYEPGIGHQTRRNAAILAVVVAVMTTASLAIYGIYVYRPDSGSQWMTSAQFQREFDTRARNGFYPREVEGRCQSDGEKFRADWKPIPAGATFFTHHGMTRQDYDRKNQEYPSQGYSLGSVKHFKDCSGLDRYQATWLKR